MFHGIGCSELQLVKNLKPFNHLLELSCPSEEESKSNNIQHFDFPRVLFVSQSSFIKHEHSSRECPVDNLL